MADSRGGTMEVTKGNSPKLHILQANLARCAKASEFLNAYQKSHHHDVSLIQEPYHHLNAITGFSLKDKIIAAPQKPKTAIVIHNNEIAAFPVIVTDTLIAVKLTWQSRTALVLNCYAPPKDDINQLIDQIAEITRQQNGSVLVAGDFNAKNPLWGGRTLDDRGEAIAEFFSSTGFTIENDPNSPPTFESKNGRSWIDLTCSSPSLTPHVHQWTVSDEETASDHKYIIIELFSGCHNQPKRLTQNGTYKILQTLKDDRWLLETPNYPINTVVRLEHVVNHLYEKINNLKTKHSKPVNNKHKRVNPWWTTELEIERKRVRAHRRRYQKAKGDAREQFKIMYLQAQKTYQNNLTATRRKSWQDFCSEIHKGNPFTLPYKIAAGKLKKTSLIPAITKDDGTTTNSTEESVRHILSTLFNTNPPNSLIADHTNGTPNQAKDDEPFTQAEVDSVVHKIKKLIAPGPDDLNTTFVQALYSHHPLFFLKIFNSALSLGHFPSKWKTSKVVLIPKKELKTSQAKPEHFRPIALNSILGKVLETLVKNRIYHHLHKNDLLPSNQFGFTHNTSTTKALEAVLEKVEIGNSEKDTTVIISLDIKNAFNHIRHEKITRYLTDNQCPPNLISLTSNSLQNRTVTFNNANTDVKINLTQGSPQGSPLSPLLWNLTITDLLNTPFPSKVHIQAFADDITLIIQASTRKCIEEKATVALQEVQQWADHNRITFSQGKCKYLTLGPKYKTRPPHFKLGAHALQHTEQLKILGVTFDRSLSFLPHLHEIHKKTTTLTSNLSRFTGKQWGMTPNQLRDIYVRGTQRLILYASPVWYKPKSHILRKLKTIQRAPLLQITKAFRTTPNSALPILANVPPVHLTIERENAFHNILHRNAPFTHNNLTFQKPNIAHKVDTWLTHPARKIAIQYDSQQTKRTDFSVYTDGSQTNSGCGAAFVVLDQSESIILSRQFKLPEHSNNFEAEAIAIIQALEHINSTAQNRSYRIFTDSLSCLNGLSNPDNPNPFINAIKTEFSKAIQTHDITFQHVKAHTGIRGNEQADQLAKEAIVEGTSTPTPVTTHFIKSQLRQKMHQKWAESWTTNYQNSKTYQWIRHPKLIPPHFPANYYTSQAITGHGRLPDYLERFSKTTHHKCKCGGQAESIDHYLTMCPLTQSERRPLENKFPKNLLAHKPEILKHKNTYNALESLLIRINELIDQT